jgi:proline racemase
LGINFSSESRIGTRFHGQWVAETPVVGWVMVDPRVTSASYRTGLQHWVVDPRDPLKHGFMSEPE